MDDHGPDNVQPVRRFVPGTIGPKGARTFYLQAALRDSELVTFKLEKQQVAALSEYLSALLEGLDPIELTSTNDDIGLIEPFETKWLVGAIGVAWDDDANVVVVGLEELPGDLDEAPSNETAHFALTPAIAANFVSQTSDLMGASRPPCPFCGTPLNDEDGWCPCHN